MLASLCKKAANETSILRKRTLPQELCGSVNWGALCRFLLGNQLGIQEGIDRVEHILPVRAEHAAGAGTVAVQSEGRDSRNEVRVSQEIGPARVTKAGATAVGIVG